jgi:hypothetical protein
MGSIRRLHSTLAFFNEIPANFSRFIARQKKTDLQFSPQLYQSRDLLQLLWIFEFLLGGYGFEDCFSQNGERDTKFKIRMIIDVLQKAGGQTHISISFILADGKKENIRINCYMFHFLWKAFLIRSLVARASSLVTAQTILPLISTAPP